MSKIILTASESSGNIKNEAVKDQKKTIEALAVLTSSISHELKNDLAAISLCADTSLHSICKKAKAAAFFLDDLQLMIKSVIVGKPNKEDFKICSMSQSIDEALEQYPFQNGECDLIHIEASCDFKYLGSVTLTNHILFNLIKNSLRAINSVNRGEIYIRLETGQKFNRLLLKDTATGIPKDFASKMFGLFESQGGTGIGLAYCDRIMQSYGGDINCSTEDGKYTEFTLIFPRV